MFDLGSRTLNSDQICTTGHRFGPVLEVISIDASYLEAVDEPQTLIAVESRLCDFAVSLAALFEQDDKLATMSPNGMNQHEGVVTGIDQPATHLMVLMEQLHRLRPQLAPETGANFWNLESAVLLANIQVMILDASMTIREVWSRVQQLQTWPEVQELPISQLASKYTTEREFVLAEQILLALQYTTRMTWVYTARRSP